MSYIKTNQKSFHKVIYATALSLIFSALTVHAEESAEKIHLDLSARYQKSEKWADAARELREAAAVAAPAQGRFYASTAGTLEYYRLNDSPAALRSYELALSLGGDEISSIVRETGAVHFTLGDRDKAMSYMERARKISESLLESDKSNALSHQNDLIEVYGWITRIENSRGNFDRALAASDAGLQYLPKTDSYILNCERTTAANWVGHQFMISGDYARAKKHYELSYAAMKRNDYCYKGQTNREIQEHIRTAQERGELGAIRPDFVYRACVAYVKDMDSEFTGALDGKLHTARDTLTEEQIHNAKISMGMLARYVETFTGGRMTISYKHEIIPATIKEMHTLSYQGVEARDPVWETAGESLHEYFFRERNNCDGYIMYWPGKDSARTANGGMTMTPFVPYQLNGSMRGYISFPANWDSPDAPLGLLHEFFHVVEAGFNLPASHGFSPENRKHYPAWKGNSQFDYFRWQFQSGLPQRKKVKTWQALSYLERYPERATPAILEAHKAAVGEIDIKKRKEAAQLVSRASDLYHSRRDRKGGEDLFLQAAGINQNHVQVVIFLAQKAASDKEFEKSARLYEQLAILAPQDWSLNALASLYINNLGRPADAVAVLEEALRVDPQSDIHPYILLQLGTVHMKLENNENAIENFDQASAETGGYEWKPSVAAQSLFWKGYILGEKYGKHKEAYGYIQRGYEKGWRDDFTLFYLKKYEKLSTSITSEPSYNVRSRNTGDTPPEIKIYGPPKDFGKLPDFKSGVQFTP